MRLYALLLAFTGDATLYFYGGSMLLAAWRGFDGCEVQAVSNWLMGGDDHPRLRRVRACRLSGAPLGTPTSGQTVIGAAARGSVCDSSRMVTGIEARGSGQSG